MAALEERLPDRRQPCVRRDLDVVEADHREVAGNLEPESPRAFQDAKRLDVAGTPILLLQIALGLEPDRAAGTLRSTVDEAPAWANGLELRGVHAYGRDWVVRVDAGVVTIDAAT
jgi:hypothetical protein